MMRQFMIDEAALLCLRLVGTRMHSETRLNGDEMRDIGHALHGIVRTAIEVPDEEASVVASSSPGRGPVPDAVISDLDTISDCIYTGQKSQAKHSAQLAFRRVLAWLNVAPSSSVDTSGST
jgi:hypothetical protein